MVFVPFGGFAPDGGEHGQGMLRASGVIPVWGGLHSVPKMQADGTVATGADFNGGYVHVHPTSPGAPPVYTGDAATEFYATETLIYTYSAGAFTDVSRGGGYGVGAGAYPTAWDFASFGNDVWATNGLDLVQRRVNNTGLFANGITSTFVPQGRFIDPVREFMVIAGLTSAGRFADEFAWSDISNAVNYDSGGASLAGTKRILSRPGQIMAFIGGEFGVFWKRGSMHALQLTGGDDIFRLDELSGGVGTPCPKSIVVTRHGERLFWGGDDFYGQSGLGPPEALDSPVAGYLLDRAATINNNSFKNVTTGSVGGAIYESLQMFGAQEPETGLVFWFYQGEGDDVTQLVENGVNRCLCFNPRSREWTEIPIPTAHVRVALGIPNFSSASTKILRYMAGVGDQLGTGLDYRWSFQSATHCAVTLATKRFVIAQEEAQGLAQYVRVRAVLPVVTPNQSTFGSDYRLATLPTNLAVRVIGADEPHFQQHNDAASTQVSPRSESRTVADADPDSGWMGVSVTGRQFLVEVSLPESTTALRGFRGVWLDYEVLG